MTAIKYFIALLEFLFDGHHPEDVHCPSQSIDAQIKPDVHLSSQIYFLEVSLIGKGFSC